jgi:hypothetical protein
MVRLLDPTGSPDELSPLGFDDGTWDRPRNLPRGQLTTLERMPSAELDPGPDAAPLPIGERLEVDALTFSDPLRGARMRGDQFLDRRVYADGLAVLHDGKLVYETYRNGMTATDRHVAHSCSKTLTTMMIGVAVDEGRLGPEQPMTELVPELADVPAWSGVTLQHVLDMATGLDTEEHYGDPASMYWRYAAAVGYYPGAEHEQIGALAFVRRELTRRLEPPGRRFNYASYLTNLLPFCLETAYGTTALELYEDRVYRHLGAEQPALINLDRTGAPIVEGQVNLTLRDFVRWGLPLADEGRSLSGRQVVPAAWVEEAFRPDLARARAFRRSDHDDTFPGAEYHNQAWQLEPGRTVAMLGIHGQFCRVDRASSTMIVGFSSYPDQTGPLLTATLQELWSTITEHVGGAR